MTTMLRQPIRVKGDVLRARPEQTHYCTGIVDRVSTLNGYRVVVRTESGKNVIADFYEGRNRNCEKTNPCRSPGN